MKSGLEIENSFDNSGSIYISMPNDDYYCGEKESAIKIEKREERKKLFQNWLIFWVLLWNFIKIGVKWSELSYARFSLVMTFDLR